MSTISKNLHVVPDTESSMFMLLLLINIVMGHKDLISFTATGTRSNVKPELYFYIFKCVNHESVQKVYSIDTT